MKLEDGVKVCISGITHKGEVPDQLLDDKLKAVIIKQNDAKIKLAKEAAEQSKEPPKLESKGSKGNKASGTLTDKED